MLQTIIGKRGRGKTSLAAELIASQKRDQIFIFDYMGEFRSFAIEGFCFVESDSSNFSKFMVDLWKRSQEEISTLVVLDEIASYCKPWSEAESQINHLYRLGRHKGIDAISINQRFYGMPPIIRSQTDIFSLFQVTEPRDVLYLQKLVSPQVLETLMHLGMFEYINISL